MNGKKVKAKGLTMKQTSSFLVQTVLASTLFCLSATTAQAVLVPIPANTNSDNGALPDGGNGYNFVGNGSNFVILNATTVGQTAGIAIDNHNGVPNTPFLVLLNFAGNAVVQGDIGTTNPLPLILLNTAGIPGNTVDFEGTLIQAGEVEIVSPGGTNIEFSSLAATPRVFNTDFLTTNVNVDQISIAGGATANVFTGAVGSAEFPFALITLNSPGAGAATFSQNVYANQLQFAQDGTVNFEAQPFLESITTLAGDDTGTVNFLGPTVVDFPIGAFNADLKQVTFAALDPSTADILSANIFARNVDVLPDTTLIVQNSPTITTLGGTVEINPNATLILPNNSNFTVNGDLVFDNGAKYMVDMNGNLKTTGVINVSGATTTSATNQITLLNPGYSPGVTTVIPLINSMGGINALPVIANPNTLLTTYATSLTNGNMVLNLLITSKPSEDFAIQSNNHGVAGAIDEIALGAPTDAFLSSLIKQMSLFTNIEDLNNALATVSPIVDGAILYESFNTQNAVFGTVGDRMDRMNFWRIHTAAPTGMSHGDSDSSDQGLWVKIFKQHGNQHHRGGVAGYKDNTWGVVVGGDTMITPLTLIGASFAWSTLDVNNDVSASKTHANSYQATMYANLDFDCPLYINAAVGLAYNNYIANRNIVFNNVAIYPRAHFHGLQTGAKAEVGYIYGTYHWHAIPIASLYYSNLSLLGYQETNAGGAGQIVQGKDYNTLLAGAGFKLVDDYVLNDYMLLQSEVHAMGFYDFFNDKMQTTSQFIGAGPSFVTSGFRPVHDSYNIGASLILFSHYNVNLSAEYDYNFKVDYYSHSGFVRARYEF